ncbi:MAG: ribonuclease P protein component [Gammaproteobacteria bacterium]|nr:MAG: ribonuclease P protein component [Gammaproteobacteria bacterium]
MINFFPKSKRLLTQRQYKSVFDNVAARSVDDCWLILAKVGTTKEHRVGLVVSKKVSKKAVERNRIKRLARESFRTKIWRNANLKIDLVVLARKNTASYDNDKLTESLDNHWKRVEKKLVRLRNNAESTTTVNQALSKTAQPASGE